MVNQDRASGFPALGESGIATGFVLPSLGSFELSKVLRLS
jgi:hypothetical protein